MLRQWIFYDYGYTKAGDALRGVLDKDINADLMLSVNIDLPFRVLRFSPSKWLKNQKFRIVNFDLHLSPFYDTAVYRDPMHNKNNFDNFLFTGGVEAVVFPEFFRSLYLVISFGWELEDFPSVSNGEIFIGTEFHY
jgi:hypothetical protein